MRADISAGTMEYNLLQDFFRLRRDCHHRGEEEDIDDFLSGLMDAAQQFMDRYREDPQLFRFAGMLATIQIMDAQERDCRPDEKMKLIVRKMRRDNLTDRTEP